MRRVLLSLTIFGVSALSQPAPAQAPIVAQMQTPSSNPWIHFAELIVPGVIGAGLALFGVWLTNRNNATTNAANRQHQLEVEIAKAKIAAEYRSNDNRWDFRKTIYVALVTSTSDVTSLLSQMLNMAATYPSDTPVTPHLQKQIDGYADKLLVAFTAFNRNASLAPLATADKVNSSIQSQAAQLIELGAQPKTVKTLQAMFASFTALQVALQSAGRKDLWGESEPKAKPDNI